MTDSERPTESSPAWQSGPYSIKRHGVTIRDCDSEPVQTPGCIQDHGALLVVRPNDLVILQASENTAALLGHAPEELLGRPIGAAIGADFASTLRGFLARESLDRNPLYAFTLPARGAAPPLDVTAHTVDGVAVVEFEAMGRATAADLDYYMLLKTTVFRLQAAASLQQFCDALVENVRALTGLDRVMVYRFHADLHGEVIAESRRDGLDPWLGLHYPADDIPGPAREIFTRIWVRPLPDASGGLAELVPLTNPETGRPLDMTYCALRGASVMYTEYLKNMQVAASLTMPIRQGGDLWGLIACHHYSAPAPMPYQVRAVCEYVAQVASLRVRAAEDREQLLYRLKLDAAHQQLILEAARQGDLSSLIAGPTTLLDGIEAGGAAFFHQGRWWRVGETPGEEELHALADWLASRPELQPATRPIFATDSLASLYPPGAAFAGVASGVLAVPLSRGGRGLLLWFRPETIRTVTWAGNPHEKPMVPGPHGPRLTPRRSFELFAESVRGRSLPWRDAELDAAAGLRILAIELVASRAEELAAVNAKLARSNEDLDAFAHMAGHDLKEPLRGIHRHVHHLLDDARALDEESRSSLRRLKSLAARMESLLDSLLSYSQAGRMELHLEEVELEGLMAEALEILGVRPGDEADVEVAAPRPLPAVHCDRVRVREIYVNLISNALKYNDSGSPRVEIGYIDPAKEGLPPGSPDPDAPHPVFFVKDNGIGIDPEHHALVFRIFRRLHARDDYGGGSGAGLTIVKKLVERHHGRIWIDSSPGEGSTFFFTLPGEPGRSIRE